MFLFQWITVLLTSTTFNTYLSNIVLLCDLAFKPKSVNSSICSSPNRQMEACVNSCLPEEITTGIQHRCL